MANKVSSTYFLHKPVPYIANVVNHGKESKFTLFAMLYDVFRILAIDVNHGKQNKFTLFAMIYDDCQILAIDVNNGKRRKVTTFAITYVDCQICQIFEFYVKSKFNFLI